MCILISISEQFSSDRAVFEPVGILRQGSHPTGTKRYGKDERKAWKKQKKKNLKRYIENFAKRGDIYDDGPQNP